MKKAEYKRVKHHHMPRDISKREKIQYRSKPSLHKRAKGFNNIVRSRTRAVLKERARKEIESEH